MDNKEKLLKIMEACMELNTLSARRREKTGYQPTVFFDFSGHIGWLEIRICSTGWDSGADYDVHISVNTDEPISDDRLNDILRKIKEAGNEPNMQDVLESDIQKKRNKVKKLNQEIRSLRNKLKKVEGDVEA